MADKRTQLILAALNRAVAEPLGLPLYVSKSTPGLFPTTEVARQAAQRCCEEGFLQTARTEVDPRSKSPVEYFTLSAKGLQHLLAEASPRQLLEDLLRALEARETQTADLVASARQMQTILHGLKHSAELVLRQVATPPDALPATNGNGQHPIGLHSEFDRLHRELLLILDRWQAAEDCPLPVLFRQVQPSCPTLTIGQFHDLLRHGHGEGRLYLHPWTGPLYAIPEPPYALLVGHEIAYYASRREG